MRSKAGVRLIMNDYVIRDARVEDAAQLVEIYSYYITDTAVSFEYDVPSVEEFAERIRKISAKYPYLVCELDGRIVGYVYAGRYSPREAYNWTVTTSIYLAKDHRRQGAGTLLYTELEKRLRDMGIVNLLAGVAYSDKEDEYLSHDSYAFHLKSGYTEVANMKAVGKKFDRWYDLLWFQKRLV